MFDLITQSMLFLLNALKSLVGSYGWAIIALTLLVRLALWPISKSQMKSMKMMQELQPKMKQIQERYKSDPQRLQAEMFKLYKDYKFNPLGGCLPMLVQLPLFIGLYWAINNPHFLSIGDPTFLNYIHLNHTGIISHGGPPHDGRMNIGDGGGFLGMGKDHIMAGNGYTLRLTNGQVLENQHIPNARTALTILPKEPRAGIPLEISTTYKDLNLEGYEGHVQSIEVPVINNSTKESENITFTPTGTDTQLKTTLDTVAGKNVFHYDVMVLVIIFGLTMLLSQKMMASQNASTGNEQQQQMMKMMPIMFAIFLFVFPIPAGVLLYMDTNSLFQAFQTWMFQRDSGSKHVPPSQSIIDIQPDRPNA